MIAASMGRPEVVSILVKARAALDLQNKVSVKDNFIVVHWHSNGNVGS